MTDYVVGFVFDARRALVLMIGKRRPAWQAGYLNGIGGRVETTDATAAIAMTRECREEAGIEIAAEDWQEFAVLTDPTHRIRFFTTTIDDERFAAATTTTDERLYKLLVGHLYNYPLVESTYYLIPLARHASSAHRSGAVLELQVQLRERAVDGTTFKDGEA